jgi:uroporphyrinogen decarboxylase
MKNLFKSVMIAALAASAVGVNAQSVDSYNKRERLLQVLDQSRPNDYVPVFFNLHFKDKFGYNAVKSHVDWFRSTHVDFVNVKYEFLPQRVEINSSADFKKIKEVPADQWAEQIEVVRELARELKQEALILPTVYSPLALLNQVAGTWAASDPAAARKKLYDIVRKDPEAVKPALEALTKSLVYYIREARKAGADGFYISSQGGDVDSFGGKLFRDIIKPYDKQLSDVANEVAPFNILHICEGGGHFSADSFNDYRDYPGSIVNVPYHEFKGKALTTKQVAALFNRPILGGLARKSKIYTGTLEEAKAEVDEILKNAPANFILGADDSVPNDSDPDKLRALVDYVHTWRQTHQTN